VSIDAQRGLQVTLPLLAQLNCVYRYDTRTITMNVTRLQQPPLQSTPARSASDAEDITPDVRRLVVSFGPCTERLLVTVFVYKTS
jgi:hypothetical protein